MYISGTRDVRFEIPADTERKAIFRYKITLPPYVTCTQCVIQWNYYTGLYLYVILASIIDIRASLYLLVANYNFFVAIYYCHCSFLELKEILPFKLIYNVVHICSTYVSRTSSTCDSTAAFECFSCIFNYYVYIYI